MDLIKFTIFIPLFTALLTHVLSEKRIRYINLLMSIVVPAIMGYFYYIGTTIDLHIWLYVTTYFVISCMLFYHENKLKGQLELFQVLYSVVLMVMMSRTPFFAVMGSVGSSFILLLLLLRQGVVFKCKYEGIGLAVFNILSDTFLFLYFVLGSTSEYQTIGSYFLVVGVFTKVLQLPYLFCILSDQDKGYLLNIIYYPLTIVLLSSFIFVNYHNDIYTLFGKSLLSSIILLVLLIFAIYSILINDLRETILTLSVIFTIKSFLMFFVLGTNSINPALESIFLITSVTVLFFLWGDITRLFGNIKIFSIYGAKEKITFTFFAFFLFFYTCFGFWGTLPYVQNMNFIQHFVNDSTPYFSTISLLLAGLLITAIIGVGVKIFAVVFMRQTEVPWCATLESGKILGSQWPYAIFITVALAYMTFLNIGVFTDPLIDFSASLMWSMISITFVSAVMFFYMFIWKRNLFESFSTSLFAHNDIAHRLFCFDKIIAISSKFNHYIELANQKLSTVELSFDVNRFKFVREATLKEKYNKDSVVVVIILMCVGTFVCFII